ncbi:MAG TPA: APC family permease [Thermoanaerobaculia bacterium]|nr:APC family permease [Thermoanaerobaculia bacterium]
MTGDLRIKSPAARLAISGVRSAIPTTTHPPPHRPAATVRLRQAVGVAFGVTVIVGNTIGAGILRTPGEVAAQLPTPFAFFSVWVLGGVYALLGAICLAELGTLLPASGGQYVYARTALGEYAGFVVGWSDWISTCGTTAAVSIVIGEYSSALIPALQGRTVAIALSVTLLFAILQWRGVKWGSRTQEITGFLKMAAFCAVVGACFLWAPVRPSGAANVVTFTHIGAIVIALQAVIYTYDGWAAVIYFSEEVRNGARNIPRALFVGVASIIAIYLGVNLAIFYVLPISEIAGRNLALAHAAQIVFGALGDPLVRGLMIISMLSGINAYHLMASRVLFAMSRDSLVSRRACAVNEGGTPIVALALSAAVAVLFIVGSGTFDEVIAVLSFFFVANYTLSFASLFVLRRTMPDAPRPYRAWGYPFTPAIALLGSVAFLAGAVAGDTRRSLWALALLAASFPVWRLLRMIR